MKWQETGAARTKRAGGMGGRRRTQCRRLLFAHVEASLLSYTNLGPNSASAKKRVDDRRGLVKHRKLIPGSNLHKGIESWRGFPLQHGFLRAAAPGLLIAQRNRMNTAKKIRQRRVHQ